MAGDKPKLGRSEAFRNLPPDAARFLSGSDRLHLRQVLLENLPEKNPLSATSQTIIGIGSLGEARTLSSTSPQIEFADTQLAPNVSLVRHSENSKKLITERELEGDLDKDPIFAIRELWGKKVRFPLSNNIMPVGRVGLISEGGMACIFYGEDLKDYKWCSFEVLRSYNPELFSNFPFSEIRLLINNCLHSC